MSDLDRIRSLLKEPAPVTWLFTGDSITHGALHTFGWRSYPEHFAERVRWELRRVRDVVINTGISGDTVPGLAADLEHRVLRFRPTVVSIMMGMNDSTAGPGGIEPFRLVYTRLVERVRSLKDVCVLLHTPNAVTSFDARYASLPEYAQAVRTVAEHQGAALVDHHAFWKKRDETLISLLQDGTIHPNHYGHIHFAQTIFKALQIEDPAAPTCRFFIP
jgi:lysophospholipase L1-like esterase